MQKGVAWPSPRFNDNGNGTITDNLTGLMWERVPSTTTYTWVSSFTRVGEVNSSGLGGYTDWRLPNKNELNSLVNFGQGDKAAWLNSQGFSNIGRNFFYWSSTTSHYNTGYAHATIYSYELYPGFLQKTNSNYVLVVRDGQ